MERQRLPDKSSNQKQWLYTGQYSRVMIDTLPGKMDRPLTWRLDYGYITKWISPTISRTPHASKRTRGEEWLLGCREVLCPQVGNYRVTKQKSNNSSAEPPFYRFSTADCFWSPNATSDQPQQPELVPMSTQVHDGDTSLRQDVHRPHRRLPPCTNPPKRPKVSPFWAQQGDRPVSKPSLWVGYDHIVVQCLPS